MNINELKKKKIAILGFGVNNQKLVDWMVRHNIEDITVCDRNKDLEILNSSIKTILGEKYLSKLDKFDVVFRTPGIPYFSKEIQKAIDKGVEIYSQTKLFFDLCPGKIIGVTGTKGKGTTATLIYRILSNRENNVYLAGNIGVDPFEYLDKIRKEDYVVVELSSFQLQDLHKGPHIAVVLNITSDHLDHHKNVDEYIQAKSSIVTKQKDGDYTVINYDYESSMEFASKNNLSYDYFFSVKEDICPGTFVSKDQKIVFKGLEGSGENIVDVKDIKLVGRHNLENVCAAITACKILGSKNEDIKKQIMDFEGNEHRLEFVAEKEGIKYFNDSASTNPDTTEAAIKSFDSPIVLIAGGSSKGLSYTKLGKEISKSNIKTIFLIGDTASEIRKSIKNKGIELIDTKKKMLEIVDIARKKAKKGDIVLLSPASASFGLFENYQDRGKQFKDAVKNIKE